MTNEITFIHFSDLHWFKDWSKDQKIVSTLVCEDIESLRAEGTHFDFAFFTGDLVQAGECQDDFTSADREIVAPILSACGISRERYIICPGNHDISRSTVRSQELIEEGMRGRLTSTEHVNRLIDKLNADSSDPQQVLARMLSYEAYRSQYSAQANEKSALSESFRIKVNDFQCGITAFNNSWRATGEAGSVDRFRLLLGERVVDEALPHLDDCDLRIALFHHPLNWMAEFDSASVKPRLFQNYDIILFGHVHEAEPEIRSTITGASLTLQSGSLFSGRNHFNGYQVVSLNPQTGEVKIAVRTYFDKPTRRWGAAENIAPGGLVNLSYKPKKKGVDPEIEKLMALARPLVRRKALEQFNIADLGSKFEQDPHDAFIVPPLSLSEEHRANLLGSDSNGPKSTGVDLADLLRSGSPVSFIGPSGAGKTSLAHFCSVMIAEGINTNQKIPVIVDARTFNPNDYGVRKAVAEYLENGLDERKALIEGRLVFLLDNYDRATDTKKKKISEYVNKNNKCGWLFFSTEGPRLLHSAEHPDHSIPGVVQVKIGYLPRRSIRTMTKRWCGTTGENAQETFEAVMRQLAARDLPRTGYIVTLLLWSMEKAQKIERLNEAHLLSAMSDFLLGKSDFLASQDTGLDSFTKEHILQEISAFLRGKNGTAPENDVLDFVIKLFREKALPYSASDVLGGFVACGILILEAGQIKFKYTRFGEFYYAQRLSNRQDELSDLIKTSRFLEFSREIELLSGLRRENTALINSLLHWLSVYPDPLSDYPLENFSALASNERYLGANEKELNDIRTKKLSDVEIDDLMDETEREMQKLAGDDGVGTTASGAIERIVEIGISRTAPPLPFGEAVLCLLLLGKVLKNSDFNSKEDKLRAVQVLMDYHVRVSMVALELFDHIFEKFLADHADALKLDEAEKKIIFSMISQRLLLEGLKIGTTVGASVKLLPLIPDAMRQFGSNLGARLYICLLWMDCGGENWHSAWLDLIADPTTPLLVQGLLAHKLTDRVNEVPMTAADRKKITELSWEIVRAQIVTGRNTQNIISKAKGEYLQKEKKRIDLAQARLSTEDKEE